uniref:Uncharacterized protein n=1 Tax=Arundo donax TaxID=35708 RepID=A0A0A9G0B7_ARUDO
MIGGGGFTSKSPEISSVMERRSSSP